MNWTRVLVALFIITLLFATYSAYGSEGSPETNNGARVSLGYSLINSELPFGEIGYEYNNWEVAASAYGEGKTKNGRQDVAYIYSLSHVVRPDWYVFNARNYYRIGVAYVDDSPLVGDTNFRLGIGMEWKLFAVEYFHYSSAGIHDVNTGIDGIQLRLKVPN